MRGGRDDDEVRRALEAFGADPASIQGALADRAPTIFSVWPENYPALDVFIAMRTQLRTAGSRGRVVGFDYGVLPWVMAQVGIDADSSANVFAKFQVAEDEFLKGG